MNQTWEQIPKNIGDNSTIEQAIDAKIVDHNNDAGAHLGADQALQSHRANEIIDHLAESVVNDKLKRTARRFVAVVDPSSVADFDTIAGAVEHARTMGGGDIYITRGTHYLSEDVYIPTTCGLVGNGIGETVIKSNSGTTRYLRLYVETSYADGYLVFYDDRNGTNTCTYNAAAGGYAAPVPGMFMRTSPAIATPMEVSGYNSSTNTLTFTTNFSGLSGEYEGEFDHGVTLTNGSSEAQLHTNNPDIYTQYYPGMSIRNTETNATYRTTGMDETGLITLAEPYTGTTGKQPCELIYLESNTINMQGITLSASSNPVKFVSAICNSTAHIESCQNVQIGSSADLGIPTMYISCLFDAGTNSNNAFGAGAHYINCVFKAGANGSYGIDTRTVGIVYGCKFLANGYVNHHWLDGKSTDTRIIGCYFESQEGETIFNKASPNPADGLKFAYNTITLENNKTLTMQIQRSVITGNRFVFSGTGGLAFNSSSSENMITNNYVVGQITDAGTNNVLNANMTTGAAQYTTLATSATACDLALNQVAQLTPNSTRTLTTTVPPKGQTRQLIILTSGTTSYTLTFGTGFKTTGTLATGTTPARYFVLDFVSTGTHLIQISRSTAIA